jgi:hypothetical protein
MLNSRRNLQYNSLNSPKNLGNGAIAPNGEASEAPATERAGNRYAQPIDTASHLDSTFGFSRRGVGG